MELGAGDWVVVAITLVLFAAGLWPKGRPTPRQRAEERDSMLWTWVFFRVKHEHPKLSPRDRLNLAQERYNKILRARSTEF